MNLLPALKKIPISNCHLGIDVGLHYSTNTRTYRRVGKGVGHLARDRDVFEAAVCGRS